MDDRVVLGVDEHLGYVHLCGRTGAEIEKLDDLCVTSCPILKDCLLSHCVRPADLVPDWVYREAVDEVIRLARQPRS